MKALNGTLDRGSKFLRNRLFDLTSRIKEVDPQLSRVIVPWVVEHPRYLPGFMRLARTIGQSRRVRARALENGVKVPPFLVLSVTSRCNLRCAGCYAGAVGTVTNKPLRPGLDLADWESVVQQAIDLGVMAFMVAGGEPFLVPGIADLFRQFQCFAFRACRAVRRLTQGQILQQFLETLAVFRSVRPLNSLSL